MRSNGQNSALSISCQKRPQREWVTHDVHVAPMWHMASELFSICAASSMQLWDMSRIYSFPHSSFGCWVLSLYPTVNAFSSSIRWETHFVLPNFASSHQWTHVFNIGSETFHPLIWAAVPMRPEKSLKNISDSSHHSHWQAWLKLLFVFAKHPSNAHSLMPHSNLFSCFPAEPQLDRGKHKNLAPPLHHALEVFLPFFLHRALGRRFADL